MKIIYKYFNIFELCMYLVVIFDLSNKQKHTHNETNKHTKQNMVN